MADRFDVAIGYNVAMNEWGHYARLDVLRHRYGFSAGLQETHRALIEGGEHTREAHRAYHVASLRYSRNPDFNPYDARGPQAQR